LFESTFNTLVEYGNLSDDTWNLIDEQEGITLWEKTLPPNSPSHLVRAVATLDVPPEILAEFVQETSVEKRLVWDPEVLVYDIKQRVDDEIEIVHQAFKAPFPVASRDFCAIRCTKSKDGVIYVFGCSIEHDSVPETKDHVRGNAIMSGYIFKPINRNDVNTTQIIHAVQLDPRGWIPAFVVNLSKNKPLDRLKQIIACFKK